MALKFDETSETLRQIEKGSRTVRTSRQKAETITMGSGSVWCKFILVVNCATNPRRRKTLINGGYVLGNS